MSHEMQRLIFLEVIRLLENRHIVGAAFMQVLVVLDIHGVDFKADIAEILARQLAGFADVSHAALRLALPCEQQDLLHAALRDDLHLMLDLLRRQLQALDIVVAVEPAVNAVILAVIGDVERREKIDGIAEMTARLEARAAGHLLEQRQRSG